MRQIVIPMLGLWMSLCGGVSVADEGPVARIGASGESLELEYPVNGHLLKDALPLYLAEGVRYFSAGVGVEERSATYPPFSLKLVFTAGEKPFLAGVAVTIQSVTGGPSIKIPRDHVNGPWLFVDLPSGSYRLTAVHADRTQDLKAVKVEAGKVKTLYLRWQDEPGAVIP